MTDILRTPEECFTSIKDYEYKLNYFSDLKGYEGIRVHYLDEGVENNPGEVFLCLHGEPTWSYIYRKMIAVFLKSGCRVIAPDLIGFGRSDKPVDDAVYTFDFHRKMLISFIQKLEIENIIIVCQDWGGILGLTLPMEFPEKIVKLVVMNTMLATGDRELSKGFKAWRNWVASNPDMDVAKLMKRSCPELTDNEAAAYGAPFPNIRYKAGVRRFPQLVPEFKDSPGAEVSRAARDFFSKDWKGQTFMAVGMQDPVLGAPVMDHLHSIIPNTPPLYHLDSAGHFVQEWGHEVASKALEYFCLPKVED